MSEKWLSTSWSSLETIVICAIGIFLAVLIFTRIAGKRSFSKMSNFDFGITVAIGSIIASTVLSTSVSIIDGAVGLGTLYVLQMGVAIFRRFRIVQKIVDNTPLLLMDGNQILEKNLKKGRVSKPELYAKLREANVHNLDQVKAVIYETTGEISVLRSTKTEVKISPEILEHVER